MKKIILIMALLFLPSTFVQAETLQLSSYYPSPFGVYNNLRLVPLAVINWPGCNANNDGLMWISAVDGRLMYCWGGNQSVINTAWTQVGNNLYPSDTANALLVVGIGTGVDVPARRLHVRSNEAGGNVMRLDSTAGGFVKMEFTETAVLRSKVRASVAEAFSVENNLGTAIFTAAQTGAVGIGETAPTAMLDILGSGVGNTLARVRIKSTDNQAGISFMSDNVGEYFIYSPDSSDDLRFFANAADRVVIQPDGDVGIGISPGVARLEIAGVGGVGAYPAFRATTGNVGESLLYDTAGNLNITGGDVFADAFQYNSDIALKDHVQKAPGLAAIMQLEGISFDWKDSGKHDVGLYAQNVEEVLPELVEVNPETNTKAVKYANLVGPLIEAVKEQQAQIDALKVELEQLKAEQHEISVP